MAYTPKAARPATHTAPLRDSVNMLFDIAIAAVAQSEKEQGRALSFILRKQDEELKAQHAWNKYNMCPDCHVLLTTSGFCGQCDYVKPKGTCRSCTYNNNNFCFNKQDCTKGTKMAILPQYRCDNYCKKP